MSTFKPDVFLDIVDRMNRNRESVMTVLTPVALLSIVPVLFFSYNSQTRTFYLNLGIRSVYNCLACNNARRGSYRRADCDMDGRNAAGNWEELRDRWGAFHIIRVAAGIGRLVLLLAGLFFKELVRPLVVVPAF